jgi:ribosomal protein S18 acetylase RimI-like enzyme
MKQIGGWKLRMGRAADVPAMYALDLVCFEEPFRFDLKSMRRFAARAGAIVVVAQAARELVGFVLVHLERGRLAYVVTLDVAPAFRRMGLAGVLMEEAERQSLDAGAERVGLHVYSGNIAAIAFYERLGFERVGVDVGFYGEGLDAWAYLKPLANSD